MKIVVATLGTAGDVRPLLAVAKAISERGSQVTFATSPSFADSVLGHGLQYECFGEDTYLLDAKVRQQMLDPLTGFGFWLSISNLANLEGLYSRLAEISRGADILVSTPFVAVAHLVAQHLGLPLINCCLSPASLLLGGRNRYTRDPHAQEWRKRLNQLRETIGLPTKAFPQMERFSAEMTLGLYPSFLRSAGCRYLLSPIDIGYPILEDKNAIDHGKRVIENWGPKAEYALFTFGSYVDDDVERWFDVATSACQKLGIRGLFLSPHGSDRLSENSKGLTALGYVDHRAAMCRAKVVVHHCGTGTLAASIAAGCPIVAAPFGLDQLYNADRLRQVDLGETIYGGVPTVDDLKAHLAKAIARGPARQLALADLDHGIGPQAAYNAADLILSARRGGDNSALGC